MNPRSMLACLALLIPAISATAPARAADKVTAVIPQNSVFVLNWNGGKDAGLFSKHNVARTNAFFERFGALAVVLARFVPILRTFAPVAAGVGHMNYRKYSLYNFVGAILWGIGLTLGGYVLGYIPPIADFVKSYIDIILLGAVVLTLIPTVYHYIRSSLKAREANRNGAQPLSESEATLKPETFE